MIDKQPLKIDKQGRVQIPIDFRKALELDSGSELISWVEDGHLIMQPRDILLAKLHAEYESINESMADELIQERREEAMRDA